MYQMIQNHYLLSPFQNETMPLFWEEYIGHTIICASTYSCSSSTNSFPFFFNKKKKEKRKINDCCRAQTKKIDSDRMGPLIKLICCNSQHNFNSNHPCVIILCIIVVPRNTLVIFEDDSPLTKVKRALQIIINLCW